MENNESLKKIAKGSFIVIIGIVLSKLFGFTYRIIAASIGAEKFGLLSIGIAILGLLTTISILGLNQGVLRYVSFYRGRNEMGKVKEILVSAFSLSLPLSVILAVILFVFSDWISVNLFDNENLSLIIKIIAIALPFNAMREILFNTFKSFQKVKYEIYAKNITENVLKVVFTVIFLLLGLSIIGAAWAYALSLIFSFILAFYFLEKKVFSIFSKFKIESFNKELILYSIPLLFSSFIFSLLLWTDTLMLGYFLPESEVGIYNIAQPIAFFLFVLPYALLTLFIPVLTELYSQNKKEEFKSVYTTVTKWIFLMNIILFSILSLFSKEIIRILPIGEGYISASVPLIILSCGYFIGYATSTIQSLFLVIKKTKLILFNTIVMAFGNILLNILLIPKYGIIGAAIATASIFVIRSILLIIESRLILKISTFNLNYVKIIFSILVASFIIKYFSRFYEMNIVYFLLSCSILVFIYGILLLLTRSFEKNDIFLIKELEEKTGKKFDRLNKFLSKFIK